MSEPAHVKIVGDIGGSNTRLALAQGDRVLPDSLRRFRNADYPRFDLVLRTYLAAMRESGALSAAPAACVIAVAGPVAEGRAALTNLDWTLDTELLTEFTGAAQAVLLNDLQAMGYALDHLSPSDLLTLRESARQTGPSLVIGVGTGFNAAAVLRDRGRIVVPASESGHISLPLQLAPDLAAHLACGRSFTSVEDALSGRGLERLYAWFDPNANRDAAAISRAVARGETGPVEAAGRQFAALLGAVTGDLALVHLPHAGIVLCGSVARALGPQLRRLGFWEAFHDKGRFSEQMQGYGLSVLLDDFAALKGCAARAAELDAERNGHVADAPALL